MSWSGEIYARILEGMRDGVMTIGSNGRVLFLNNAAEEILGLSREALMNRPFGEIFLVQQENDDFNQTLLDAVYDKKSIHHNVTAYSTGEQTLTLSVTTSFLEMDDSEMPFAVVIVFSDLTEVEHLKVMATTDVLTGSWNRGFLVDNLPREMKRAQRYGLALSVVMADIDHFKKVNDTYGHHAGDVVLKEFVRCAKTLLRKDLDWIARYGGEEFVIVLPDTDLEGAGHLAERVRHAVSKMEMRVAEHLIRITASFGVTTLNLGDSDGEISAERLIAKADECLYQAKTTGRNRVISGDLSGRGPSDSTPDPV
jgi:diguanylate cyclase (GGDEF)-like protein/PAS domain S-box-containing protein